MHLGILTCGLFLGFISAICIVFHIAKIGD